MATAIRVELQLADGSFTSGMLRAGQTVAQFNAQLVKTNPALANIAKNNGNLIASIRSADTDMKDFVGTLRDLSIVTGVISMGVSAVSGAMSGWFGEIIRVNAEMQRMQIMMQGMSKSADPIKEAGDNVKYLRDMAMNTPFSLDALASGFVKLQSTGIDPMAGSMQSLADGIAAFGGSDAQFERAVVAITQMSGKGVIQMEELRQQLGEHMPRAVELMARSMGVGIAELLEEISTGTMAAKPALDAFYQELERTYGGRAQSMMQTFEGQMKQTMTLWTNLLTRVGGMDQKTYEFDKNGLFMTITDQLRDLNEILAQPFAFDMAGQIGAGLTNVVMFLRSAIETVVTFRREILTVAQVLATAFAGRAAIIGIGQLVTGFSGLVQHLKIFKIEMMAASSYLATGASGFKSLTTAGIGAQMMTLGLATGIKGVGTALMASMPWVAAVGLAVYAAAEYFDIFGNKVRNAYDDLQNFGAETRKQAIETSEAYIKELEERLAGAKFNSMFLPGSRLPGFIADLERQIAEARSAQQELVNKAGVREDERAQSEFQRQIDLRMEARQREYDDLARTIQDEQDLRAKDADNVEAVEEERRKRLYDARMDQLADNEEYLRTLLAQNENFVGPQLAATEARLKRERGVINAHLLQIREQRQRLLDAGVDGLGIEHFENAEGGGEAIEKGEKALADLRREVQELQLQLGGATSEHAKLQVAIANGDYGTIEAGGAAVQELHDQLIATTKAKEALDELMESRSEAEKDTERARKEALEEQFDILVRMKEAKLGRELLPSEINQLKLDTGYYEGLGPTEKITEAVDALVKEFGNVETGSKDAGIAIANDGFGQRQIDAVQALNFEVMRLNAAMGQTSALASGIQFGGMDGFLSGGSGMMASLGAAVPTGPLPEATIDRMAMAMERLMSKGWSREVAAAIVGNIGGESGYNPDAINPGDGSDGSDSIGLGQWNADRARNLKQFAAQQGKEWNDYLTQIDFVDWELNNTHKSVGNKLRGPVSLEGATNTVLREYEVPADPGSKYGTRLGYAQQAYGASAVPQLQAENAALETRNDLIETGVQLTESLTDQNTANATIEQRNQANNWLLERNALLDDLNAKLEKAGRGIETSDDALDSVREAIEAGELGDIKDPDARQYEALIQAATRLDYLNAKIEADKEAQTELAGEAKELEQERLSINQELADIQAQLANPNYIPESSALRQLEARLDAYVEKARKTYGEESAIYQQKLQERATILDSFRAVEAGKRQVDFQRETQQLQLSTMTQAQQRQHSYQQAMAQVDAYADYLRQQGVEEVEITRQVEERKAAIRTQYAQTMSPLSKQMQEWGDLQGNLAQQSTQWMDSLAGGITDLIMGTGDLRSVIQGIMKDMVNMLVKYMMSGMKGGKGAAGGAGKAAKGLGGGGAGKLFGMAHTGGVIGASQLSTRRASASVFTGAPKFHTGGIIGPRLMPSEVPIIAQEGEGVFTKEQMANLQPAGAGGQIVNISSPITVNGSAGTPEQNQDLAKRMRREMEAGMRTIVADELRKQTKPGNMMNTRSR